VVVVVGSPEGAGDEEFLASSSFAVSVLLVPAPGAAEVLSAAAVVVARPGASGSGVVGTSGGGVVGASPGAVVGGSVAAVEPSTAGGGVVDAANAVTAGGGVVDAANVVVTSATVGVVDMIGAGVS